MLQLLLPPSIEPVTTTLPSPPPPLPTNAVSWSPLPGCKTPLVTYGRGVSLWLMINPSPLLNAEPGGGSGGGAEDGGRIAGWAGAAASQSRRPVRTRSTFSQVADILCFVVGPLDPASPSEGTDMASNPSAC